MTETGNLNIQKKLSQLKAVILDMDGVLVDTEPIQLQAFEMYLKQLGIPTDENFLKSLVGYSVDMNIRQIFDTYFPGTVYDLKAELAQRDSLYLHLLQSFPLQPMEGIPELVHLCKASGIRLALASSSSKKQVDAVLNRLDSSGKFKAPLRRFFTAVLSGDDVGQRKPHPEIYLKVLEKLGVAAGEAMAIEDSSAGIQSARRAGLFCVALQNEYFPVEKLRAADWVVDSLQTVWKQLRQSIGSEGKK